MADHETVEDILLDANQRLMCLSSPLRFAMSERTIGGYPMVDLVKPDGDDEVVTTITATMLSILIRGDCMTTYVQTALADATRAYDRGVRVGRAQIQTGIKLLLDVEA